jgi:hypothetical protein
MLPDLNVTIAVHTLSTYSPAQENHPRPRAHCSPIPDTLRFGALYDT